MEAVPRLPMLKVETKDNHDFIGMDWMEGTSDGSKEILQDNIREELKKHIRENYSDDPEKYKDCINNFLELQTSAYKVITSPDFEGCNTLKKYYGQLHYMQSRFPFTGENALNVMFGWADAFTGIYTQHNSFVFEQSAILFNLGAIHSYLGSMDNRTSEEGTKVSCVHFQCAAGFFQYIADHLDTTLSPEISQFMLKLYINVMLGQAQECLLEKSMQDNRKPSIIAKICQQVVDYYQLGLNSLNQAEAKELMADANRLWIRLISFKIAFYSAVVKYYLGSDDWDQEKYGEGVAYLESAMDTYKEAVKLAKSLKGNFKSKSEEALKYSADVFGGKSTSVKNDNDFIYHERVPDKATLPDVKGASLVKALPYDPSNSAITGPDIFGKLVPLEAHLVASTYSEEKAKLLRPIITEVEEKNSVLEQYKRAIELDPDKLIKIDDEDRLDPALIEHCAALSVDQTPIQALSKAMKVLSGVFMDIETLISDTVTLVNDEESETKQVKDICGKTIDSENEITRLKKELEVCKEVQDKARQMNNDVHTAMKSHIVNLKIVAEGLDALKKECKLSSTAGLITEEDKEVISLVEKLSSKVVEMEVQRQSLVSQLRSQLEEDDVTATLMTKPGVDAEDLFQEELKKHDSLIGYIKQNLAAQENILNAVTEANVRYTKIRKVVDSHKEKVKSKCDNFLHSCTDYSEAVKRCQEGTDFFMELQSKVKEINEKMKEIYEKNSKKRKSILDKHEAKKPPPRPSAPKPKLSLAKPAPGTSLFSMQELADLADDDMEEFNDPAFLRYLQMSGGLPQGMSLPNASTSQPTLRNNSAARQGYSADRSTSSINLSSAENLVDPRLQNPGGQQFQSLPSRLPTSSNQSLVSSVPPQHYDRSVAQQQTPTSVPTGLPNSFVPPRQPVVPEQQSTMAAQQPIMSLQPSPRLPHVLQQPVSQEYQQPGHLAIVSQPAQNFQQPVNQSSPQTSGGYQQPSHQIAHEPMNQPPRFQVSQESYSSPHIQKPFIQQQPTEQMQTISHGQQVPSCQGYQQPPSQQPINPQAQQSVSQGYPQPFIQQSLNHPSQQSIPHGYQQPSGQLNQPMMQLPAQEQFSKENPQAFSRVNQQAVNQPPQQSVSHSYQQPAGQLNQPVMQIPPQESFSKDTSQAFSRVNQQPASQPPQQSFPHSYQQPAGHLNQSVNQFPQRSVSQEYPQPSSRVNPQPVNHPPQHSFPQAYQQPANQLPQQSFPQGYQQSFGHMNQQPMNQSRPHLVSQGYLPATSGENQQPVNQPSLQSVSQGHQPPSHQVNQRLMQPGSLQPQHQPSGQQSPLPQGYQQHFSRGAQQPVSHGSQQTTNQNMQHTQPQRYPQPSYSSHSQPGVSQAYNQPAAQSMNQGVRQPTPQNFQQPPHGVNKPPVDVVAQHPAAQSHPQPIQQRFQQPLQQNIDSSQHFVNQPVVRSSSQVPYQQSMPQSNRPATPHSTYQPALPNMPNARASPQPPIQTQLPRQPLQNSPVRHPVNNRFSSPAANAVPFSHQPQQMSQFSTAQTQRMPNAALSSSSAAVTSIAPINARPGNPNFLTRMPQPNTVHPAQPSNFKSPIVQQTNPMQPIHSTNINQQQQQNLPSTSQPPVNMTQTPQNLPNSSAAGLSQPLNPIIVSDKKLVQPLQPTKPSADLEGLTYTPSQPRSSNTSADELLSSSPEPTLNVTPETKSLLVPTKVDSEDIVVRRIEGIPYNSDADLMKFKTDCEEFQKRLSSLLMKTPGTLCQLDKDWKKISEVQEKSARQQSTAIGRCSSYKNRFQDILPFDQNRIVLKESKDDYINASLIDGITHYCPRFIAAQSPLPTSCGDFWTMIFEQQVTVIVMLVSKNEIPKKCAKYWPEDRNVPQKFGAVSVTFTTSRVYGNYIERTFTMKHNKSSLPRSLTQLHYTAWPDHGLPASSSDLLSFMDVVQNFHSQQRSLQWPIVVHCENGVGHTGTFCSAYACIKFMDAGLGFPNILEVVEKIKSKRKHMLQEKAQLKFLHDLIYIHAVDLLKQRGVDIENRSKPIEKPSQQTSNNPSQTSVARNDLFDVFGSGALSSIRASVDKLTVRADRHATPVPTPSHAPPPSNTFLPEQPQTDINSLIGSNVSDLVQGTIQQPAEPEVVSPKPDVVSSCEEPEVVINSKDQKDYVINQSNLAVANNLVENIKPTALAQPTTAVTEAQSKPTPSILDQMTPESFTLGTELKEKKRITKADFFKPNSQGIDTSKDANDPFGDLDPLWSLKK